MRREARVRALARRWSGRLGGAAAAAGSVCLLDEDGRPWSFRACDGGVRVEAGRADAVLEIEAREGSWSEVLALLGAGAVGPGGEGGFCGFAYLLCDPELGGLLRLLRHSVVAEVSGAERPIEIALSLGHACGAPGVPSSVIEIDRRDFAALGRGELEQLFWSGRLRIRGDFFLLVYVDALLRAARQRAELRREGETTPLAAAREGWA